MGKFRKKNYRLNSKNYGKNFGKKFRKKKIRKKFSGKDFEIISEKMEKIDHKKSYESK